MELILIEARGKDPENGKKLLVISVD